MGKNNRRQDSPAGTLSEALDAVEQLAKAAEALTDVDAATAPELVELASRLLKVSESIADAAEESQPSQAAQGDEGEAGLDEGGEEVEDEVESLPDSSSDVLSAVQTTLERVNTLLDGLTDKPPQKPAPEQPLKPEPADESQALSKDIRSLLTAVDKQQQRLARLEKRFGMPNSLPIGEARASPEDESWPRDLNQPVDRESVDKSVSFHDAPSRKEVR